MEALKLLAVFLVIVILLHLRRPLPQAIGGGVISACFLYSLGFVNSLGIAARSFTSAQTVSLLVIFYLIMFLQRMLEKRGCLLEAQQALDGLSSNRRVNTALAPMVIGLLPSAAAITICGTIVNSYCKDYLNAEERTLITTYFRHIPESFVPTYASIIIGVELSGVPLSWFILGMLPLVVILAFLGYFFLLRTLPVDTGRPLSPNRAGELAKLGKSLWTLGLIVALVLAFHMPVYWAALTAVVLYALVGRFRLDELKPIFWSAFEKRLLITSAMVMLFKDVVAAAGVIETLPAVFTALPVPTFFVFFLIFFFGTIASGQQAMTAIAVPLAFAAMPGGGMPLLILLLSAGYIAMQISPTHLCLAVVTEYFHTSMSALIRRTMPIVFWFSLILLGYYLLLVMLLQ